MLHAGLECVLLQFATSRVEAAEKKERKKGPGEDENDGGFSTPWDSRLPARGETPLLMLDRWRKLHDELYDGDTGFDITKVRLVGEPPGIPLALDWMDCDEFRP